MLDTNICVELLRGRGGRVFERLKKCEEEGAGISSVTLAELVYGVEKSARPQKHRVLLAQFCAPLVIWPFDDRAAEVYGRVRSSLEKQGLPIGPLDMLIASHALAVGACVVTNNQKEFGRVKGLKVENWMAG